MRQALTDLAIKAVPVPATGSTTIYDATIPGFGIRVSQGGTRSFVVKYGPRRLLKTLGKYPAISLKKARSKAASFLATANPDPSRTKAQEAISAFLEHSRKKKNRPRTTADYDRLLNRHFPSGKLANLTRQQLLTTLSGLSRTPGEQAHAFSSFNVFLNWCVANGHMESNPIAGIRGLGHVGKRERVLSDDELKRIWKALGDDTFSTIVRILILTGVRRGEAQHIVVEGEIATIKAEHTKNRRVHVFPVGPLARKYLGSDLSFNGWGKCKTRIDKASGVSGWTFHDLRRSFASRHAAIGTAPHVIERLLNHISGPTFGGVAGIYNRHDYLEQAKEACLSYETHIQSVVLAQP